MTSFVADGRHQAVASGSQGDLLPAMEQLTRLEPSQQLLPPRLILMSLDAFG
jgi:hypothetical protein